MRYRVRGPLQPDPTRIAAELRGFIAHTGPIRLGYLQMHSVAAQTIEVADAGAAFFEETVLPKVAAVGALVEQPQPLRQPKELSLQAVLTPTTATSLPSLAPWAGVRGDAVFTARGVRVHLRCLPDDAPRLRELAAQGWTVRVGWRALLPWPMFPWRASPASVAPQFWPEQAPALAPDLGLIPASGPADVTAASSGSAVTADDILASPDEPHLVLGVTLSGQGVRLKRRAMVVAVRDDGMRQEAVVTALMARAAAERMGLLVIAERGQVSPRALAPFRDRVRLLDMADPWESASIPWRSLPAPMLERMVGPLPPTARTDSFGDVLRAAGRGDLASPVVEALTREPGYDLAGTLNAGGGIVLLVEPGPAASLLASLLLLHLSQCAISRPLLVCRPAALTVPPGLRDQAIQVVAGDVPDAAVRLTPAGDRWVAVLPGSEPLTLQANLAAPVTEQTHVDDAALALVAGLQGLGWTGEPATSVPALGNGMALAWPEDLGDTDAEAGSGLPDALTDDPALVVAKLEPAAAEAGSGLPDAQAADPALAWPEDLTDAAAEASLGLPAAQEADSSLLAAEPSSEEDLGLLDAQEADSGILIAEAEAESDDLAALNWPVDLDEPASEMGSELPDAQEADSGLLAADVEAEPDLPGFDVDAWDVSLRDHATGTHAAFRRHQPTSRRKRRVSFTPSAASPSMSAREEKPGMDSPPRSVGDIDPALIWMSNLGDAEAGLGLPDALTDDPALDWPANLGEPAPEAGLGLPNAAEANSALVAVEAAPDGAGASSLNWPADLGDPKADEGFELPDAAEADSALVVADAALEASFELAVPADADSALGWQDDLGEAGPDASVELPDAGKADSALVWMEDLGEPTPATGLELPNAAEADPGLLAVEPVSEAELGLPDNLTNDAGLDWPDDLSEPAPETELGLPDAAEADPSLLTAAPTPVVGLGLPDADATIPALVLAWQDGTSLTVLARELQRQRPDLSLIAATQALQRAIHDAAHAITLPPNLTPATAITPLDHLLTRLHGIAQDDPTTPAAQDALHGWKSGGKRRHVAQDIARTYGLRELDARALYDQVILPRVISDLNGSACEVVRFLIDAAHAPGSPLSDVPPSVVDCAARLLGGAANLSTPTRTNTPAMRAALATLLPAMHTALATLAQEGDG